MPLMCFLVSEDDASKADDYSPIRLTVAAALNRSGAFASAAMELA
jgi:hypothetical protein